MNTLDPHAHMTSSTRRARARRRILATAGIVTLAFPILALASPLDIPNEFSDGDVISADAFNENFEMVAASVDDNDARITALEQLGAAEFPSGGVVFFNTATCPEGWAELQTMRGRVPVGLPSGGTLAATVGTELDDSGTNTISQVPNHSHGVGSLSATTSTSAAHSHSISGGGHSHPMSTDGDHDHDMFLEVSGGYGTFGVMGTLNNAGGNLTDTAVANAGDHTHTIAAGTGTHGHTVGSEPGHGHTVTLSGATANNTGGVGSVDVTMPYIQLLACQKS